MHPIAVSAAPRPPHGPGAGYNPDLFLGTISSGDEQSVPAPIAPQYAVVASPRPESCAPVRKFTPRTEMGRLRAETLLGRDPSRLGAAWTGPC